MYLNHEFPDYFSNSYLYNARCEYTLRKKNSDGQLNLEMVSTRGSQ